MQLVRVIEWSIVFHITEHILLLGHAVQLNLGADKLEVHAWGGACNFKPQAVSMNGSMHMRCGVPLALSVSEEQAPGADHLGVVQDLGQSEPGGTCKLHSLRHSGQALQQLLQQLPSCHGMACQAQHIC